jgi:pimeloyl-ACP methyl ester carboxylesterase
VRFSVPAQSLDVVRADVASVAARREVAARPGDEIVRIPGDGFVLGATVSRPPGSPKTGTEKLPAVILVAGSGSANRDEAVVSFPVFAEIASALSDAGFLVVRYDKRGTGDSGGRTESAVISDYADDANAVVRYLERRKDVDKQRIAMVAHGDGTWTALLAAARNDRIAALALIGGSGTTGAEFVLDMQQRALARMSIPDADKQKRIDLQRKIQKAVVTGTGWEGVPADMRKQADTPWFQSFLMFDPAKVVPRTKQPMLILRGALDTQVSLAEYEKLVALAGARKGPAGRAVQAGVLAGLNHILVPATTGEVDEYTALTDRHVGKELLDTLIAWLKATFAGLQRK